MRRRRVERLIVRAENALAENNTDEVHNALAEMRRLDPGLPQIRALEEKLVQVPAFEDEQPPASPEPAAATIVDAPLDAPTISTDVDAEALVDEIPGTVPAFEPQLPDRRLNALLIAAASLMMAAAGVSTYWFYRSPQHEETVAAQAAASTEMSSVSGGNAAVAAPPSAPVLGDSADIQVETVEATMVESLPLEERKPEPHAPAPEPQEPARQASDASAPRPLPAATSGITVPLAQSTTPIEPPPPAPEPRRDVPVEARNVAPLPAPDINALPPKLERLPADPVPARLTDDVAVRGILDRYADAYSRLDASAAQEIWPRVNRSALSRAFEGLASQQVSLERCDVDVHGITARAICAGSATWAPKIGNGELRTEPRNWTFQLAKAGSDWQIVSARVQQPQNK